MLTRLIDGVFHDIKFEFVYHYLDEVVFFSRDFSEHLNHLWIVLQSLREEGLTLKQQKSVFATEEISFLGHLISADGVKIDPERTRTISVPTSSGHQRHQ
jgi:hypothetical protein